MNINRRLFFSLLLVRLRQSVSLRVGVLDGEDLELDPAIERAYRSRFPDDRLMTNLGHWHEFETERPATFAAMYLFWVQAA